MVASIGEIQAVARRIGREFGARRIILFGSRSHGTARSDSDVDLLVIMPFSGHRADQSVAIRMKLRPTFPVDLVIRSPQEVKRRLAMGDLFLRDILEHGKVLYEADDG